MRRSRATRAGERALTLVELMVSLTLLGVIVGLLTSVFNTTTRAWTGTEGGNERRRGARSLTDFIGAELRGAMLPVTLSSTDNKPNLQMLINPSLEMVPQDYQNPHSIFWQAPLATERTLGDVAELGYYVKWEESGPTPPSLRRFFVNPSLPGIGGLSATSNPDFLIYSQTQWLSRSLLERVAPASAEKGYAGLFADNVLGLWVEFYGIGNQPVLKPPPSRVLATEFNSRIGYTYKVEKDPLDPASKEKAEQRYLPLSVSISIAQLDTRHAKKLEKCWSEVRNLVRDEESPNARDFLRRLRLQADRDPRLRALLPGLQIYETNVLLDNGR